MSYEDHWLRSQDWIIEKMKSCDGALIPMDAESQQRRLEPELDYQFFLENASRTMIRFKKPEHLIRMIVRIMDEQVKVTHTAMLLYEPHKDSFIIIDSKGSEGTKIPVGYIKILFGNICSITQRFRQYRSLLAEFRNYTQYYRLYQP